MDFQEKVKIPSTHPVAIPEELEIVNQKKLILVKFILKSQESSIITAQDHAKLTQQSTTHKDHKDLLLNRFKTPGAKLDHTEKFSVFPKMADPSILHTTVMVRLMLAVMLTSATVRILMVTMLTSLLCSIHSSKDVTDLVVQESFQLSNALQNQDVAQTIQAPVHLLLT